VAEQIITNMIDPFIQVW